VSKFERSHQATRLVNVVRTTFAHCCSSFRVQGMTSLSVGSADESLRQLVLRTATRKPSIACSSRAASSPGWVRTSSRSMEVLRSASSLDCGSMYREMFMRTISLVSCGVRIQVKPHTTCSRVSNDVFRVLASRTLAAVLHRDRS
jgi:hypothetical protein